MCKLNELLRKHSTFENINNHIHNNRQRNLKFYDWNGIKYLLWNYEAYLNKNTVNKIEDYSKFLIDVIFPEDESFSYDYPNVRKGRQTQYLNTLKYSLGNITITTKKRVAMPFLKLKPLLQNGTQSDLEISINSDWTDEIILSRGMKILKFIENHWDLEIGIESDKRKLLIENLRID